LAHVERVSESPTTLFQGFQASSQPENQRRISPFVRTVWLKELPSDGSLVYPILGPRKGFNFVFHDTWWVAITGRKKKRASKKSITCFFFKVPAFCGGKIMGCM
jgi:hypothetical protein